MAYGRFTKGNIPWCKGKKFSEEHKKKLSIIHKSKPSHRKGKKLPKQVGEKISIALLGGKRSIETRLKMSSSHLGNKHWNWQGRKVQENLRIRNSIETNLWREAVFARDNWTCQKCGKRGKLNAHHIKSFAKFPQLRFAIDNGLTLCINCHLLIKRG
jgi:5-methylcytosine-specific restriction endonuclease McrA